MATITIRYWAGAREAAGVDTDTVQAANIAEAMQAVHDRRQGDAEFARVMSLSSLLCDGRRVADPQREDALTGDVELEVLPPFAGG